MGNAPPTPAGQRACTASYVAATAAPQRSSGPQESLSHLFPESLLHCLTFLSFRSWHHTLVCDQPHVLTTYVTHAASPCNHSLNPGQHVCNMKFTIFLVCLFYVGGPLAGKRTQAAASLSHRTPREPRNVPS